MLTPEIAVDLVAKSLQLVMLLVAILVGPALLVGLLVSLFQAATQINEQTLSFLPRLLVTLLVITLLGHWMAMKLMDFCIAIFQQAASLVL
jgi:flagellar biosynthesis protein FliQ